MLGHGSSEPDCLFALNYSYMCELFWWKYPFGLMVVVHSVPCNANNPRKSLFFDPGPLFKDLNCQTMLKAAKKKKVKFLLEGSKIFNLVS